MSADLPGTRTSRTLLKVAALLGLATLAGVSCAPATTPPSVPVAQTGSFQVNVVDSTFDAGRSASVRLGPDGQPAVAYLLYQPVLKEGEIPPAVKPGESQPPSIVLATQDKGIWSRTSIPPQAPSGQAGGLAPEIADQDGKAVQGVTASLAVDGQGKHHVVWATPKGLFYDTDAGGSFGDPDMVTSSPSFGASIAAADDGTAWISYYSGGSLDVARGKAGSWSIDHVAVNAGPSTAPATVTAIALGGAGTAYVAFASQGRTEVARGSGSSWSTTTVPGDGGYGVSLSLDKDGNPHVAYYDANGGVHAADSTGGASWTVTDIGTTSSSTAGQPDAGWSSGIAVDGQGVHRVAWADTAAQLIVVSSDQGGQFSSEPIQGSAGGSNPSLAASADGTTVAVAWFDATNTNLDVAVAPASGLVLAHPTPTNQQPSGGPTTPTPSGTALPCEPSGTTLQIAAQGILFDKDCLAAPAGQAFSIDFTNNDAGVPHNVDIYDTQGGTHIAGATDASDTLTGPGQTTYQVDPLDAGIYFFQCDVHPTTMFGTFVVAKPAS